jgi:hypothetical protein
VANIYVIDRRGIILKQITGPANATLQHQLFRTIDGALGNAETR